jgi:hypothetical protein
MSTMQDLIRLVTPPAEPVDADGEWRSVWSSLGTELPHDYQDLVRTYGLGSFDDVVLWTPFTTRSWANLVVQARDFIDDYGPAREHDPLAFPYPIYPEPGGLLPWASTGDGDSLSWLTIGVPDDWPVVESNIRERMHRHDVGTVAFLYGYLAGARESVLLRPPPPAPWFDPYRERIQCAASLVPASAASDDSYRRLRAEFEPTADRAVWDGGDGNRQDQFKVLDRDWLVTYNRGTLHSIWIDCPPEDAGSAKAALLRAAAAIGCQVGPT